MRLTIIIFSIIIFFILIIGFFNSIFVNPDLFTYHWDKILIVFVTLFTLVKSFDKNSFISKGFRNINQKNNFYTIVTIMLGMPILLSILLSMSIPSFFHALVKKQTTMIVTISEKTTRSKRCLTFVYTTDNIVKGFCLDEKIYRDAEVGDKLILKGDLSVFGFNLDHVQKLK